ncbi:M50 family metallopeptidase, partial [Brachybacterium squillarum]|uniref:M50 family metallopeptidase n=1 Tax=Brachybacterium squillarum TaxID=661979 RepID=UPI0029CA0931
GYGGERPRHLPVRSQGVPGRPWHHGRMDLPTLLGEIGDRAAPGPVPSGTWWPLVSLALALVVVLVSPLWRLLRPAVTIVHELGHAVTGILAGRRFTGFVVSADMSGHAITVGRPRGPGRVISAWSGYPAPALLGAVLIQVALAGAAGTALAVALAALLVSLVFTRSVHTVLAVLGSAAVVGAVWWWGSPALVALVTLAVGAFLLMGAWRHVLVVASSGGRGDDPAQLARLTPLPAAVWIGSYLLVLAACTLWALAVLAPSLRELL